MRWIKKWPVWLAAVVALLNVELVVVPIILKWFLGLSGLSLSMWTTLWTISDMFFWGWFCCWVMKEIKKSEAVREAVEIKKETAPEVRELVQEVKQVVQGASLIPLVENWVRKHLIEPFSPQHSGRKTALLLVLKSLGYILGLPVLFLLGLAPVIWTAGLLFCCLTGWRLGFIALLLGNVTKNVLWASWILPWLTAWF